MSHMDISNDILKFLAEGEKGISDIRAKFGKYPRKQMFLLLGSGAVQRIIKNKKVVWLLADDAKEDIDSITEALDKAMELIEECGTEEDKKAIETEMSHEMIAEKTQQMEKLIEDAKKITPNLPEIPEIPEIEEEPEEEEYIYTIDGSSATTEEEQKIVPLPSFSGDVMKQAEETKKSNTEEQRVPQTSVEPEVKKKGFFAKLFGK